MLTAVQKGNNRKIRAADAARIDAPFVCPECKTEVVLRKGTIKTHHFAHKPPVLCEYGTGESEDHRRCKNEIYGYLACRKDLVVEMEKGLEGVRPDIYIESIASGKRYAIEVQLSNLTIEKIAHRTAVYDQLGIYVLWLPKFNQLLRSGQYAPSAWERWLHAAYFGTVYYWSHGPVIYPVKFNNYMLWVEEYREYGGYERISRRYKTPLVQDPIQFPDHFKGTQRGGWSSDNHSVVIPPCKILIQK